MARHISKDATGMHRFFFEKLKLHPGYIVLVQVGDFYECYGENGHLLSELINIAPPVNERKVTGFPVTSLMKYIKILVEKNYNIAVYDQFKISNSTKFERKLTKVFTPGTIFDEDLLDEGRPSYLMSIVLDEECNDSIGLCWGDVSTGTMYTDICKLSDDEGLFQLLNEIKPKEIICQNEEIKRIVLGVIGKMDVDGNAYIHLHELDPHIKNYNKNAESNAVSYFYSYLEKVQSDAIVSFQEPKRYSKLDKMHLTPQTVKSLNLMESLNSKKNSLFKIIDRTCTAGGKRLLFSRLNSPSTDMKVINDRLKLVDYFVNNPHITDLLRIDLKNINDIERISRDILASRPSKTGIPQKFIRILNSLKVIKELKEKFISLSKVPEKLETLFKQINYDNELLNILEKSLNDKQYKSCVSDGYFVKDGYCRKIDAIRIKLDNNSDEDSKDFLEKYVKELKIDVSQLCVRRKSRKWIVASKKEIRHPHFLMEARLTNGEFQYSLKVTPLFHSEKALDKQKQDIDILFSQMVELEVQIFEDIQEILRKKVPQIDVAATALSELDVALSNAIVAIERNLSKPILTKKNEIDISVGRHLMVESIQLNSQRTFVPNDCLLDSKKRFSLITGPNMGGKSTFLRQVALIVILAQTGCYIPAKQAKIGLRDAVFTRIGANDDLTKNESTFMVEMKETEEILKRATSKSLVLLDEVGRGTSAREGLAIAYAVCQHLAHRNESMTLFATHYHELADELKHDTTVNFLKTEAARDENGSLMFIHKLSPGVADHSHGIDIAELAGLPKSVTSLAREYLNKSVTSHPCDSKTVNELSNETIERIKKIDLNTLNGVKALCLLEELKNSLTNK